MTDFSPELAAPLLAAAVQAGTPILYATLGEILTERSGVLNLGVEGMMLAGALAGFVTSLGLNDPALGPWLGFAAGGAAGALLAALHAVVCLYFQGNQVVSGLALTIFGTGLTAFLGLPFEGKGAPGFTPAPLPLLGDLPFLGQALFSHDPLVYPAYLLPGLLAFMLRYTRWGLWVRMTGENPAAVAAAGLSPRRVRLAAVLAGGALAGLGGAYLSLAYTHLWTNGLTAGRGWIAVALVIFAFWRPWRAVTGALLFGGVMAFQLRLQAMGAALPSSLMLMLPYVMTILALVLASWRNQRHARRRSREDGDRSGRRWRSWRFGRVHDAPAMLGVNLEPED